MAKKTGAALLFLGYAALVVILWVLLFRAITWPITGVKRVGLAFGCMTYVVFCCQFLLSARLKWLDRLVSQDRLLTVHGVMAVVGMVFVWTHGTLVRWNATDKGGELAEVGEIASFLFLLTVIGGALLLGTRPLEHVPGYVALRRKVRSVFRLKYHWCVWMHNFALVAATAMLVHIFLLGAPTMVPFKVACATLYAVCIGTHAYHRLLRSRILPLWHCTRVTDETQNVQTLCFAGGEGQEMAVVPGQFAYLSIRAHGLQEFHPATIAGTEGKDVEFSIKAVGDWTRDLTKVNVGDEAVIHGPFGAFTTVGVEENRPLLLVAGGIGVTPFLAMIRDAAAINSGRPITLVWSVRAEDDAFARGELAELAGKLAGLHVNVRVTDGEQGQGRLDQASLAEIAGERLAESEAFVCGPPVFMDSMIKDLRRLGVPSRRIHAERFAY